MRLAFAALLLSLATTKGNFANDEYTDHPDVLLRVITAAAADNRFKSSLQDGMVFYLRRAEYIGPLEAPFGTVHVARLFYIRSGPRGSNLPGRGHTFIIFFDDAFKIQNYWMPDFPDDTLSADETKLLVNHKVVLDYTHIPKSGTILVNGKVMNVPQWTKK